MTVKLRTLWICVLVWLAGDWLAFEMLGPDPELAKRSLRLIYFVATLHAGLAIFKPRSEP